MIKRRWKWIGHTLRKAPNCVTSQSLTWNPQCERRIGRPKDTLHRETETDIGRKMNKNCKEMPGTEWVGEYWSVAYAPLEVKGVNENNLYHKRKDLIHELKLNVKTLMEYASVCRSIPEDSTHVISFCALVHDCLQIGLKTSSFLFNQTISTYTLLHKISNQCEPARKIINKFEKHFNSIKNNHRNNSQSDHHDNNDDDDDHHHHQQQQQQQSIKRENKSNLKKLFHYSENNKNKFDKENDKKFLSEKKFYTKLRTNNNNSNIEWIHFALVEKLLETIIQHICSRAK
ncbi:unnamed protein product [Schistosoma margrebowiei]|uniref:Uncharacterized protein n=1 Tax=Schistosoma margrebowiei TaxID=48269 RepID=A0A183MTX5_9TREM|nr:unnamed protein product [Schistosoma margrebowiei]